MWNGFDRLLGCGRIGATAMMWLGLWQAQTTVAADMPATQIKPGDSVDLLQLWPEVAQAPQKDLATIEVLVRPAPSAIRQTRSFILVLSNSGGQDTAGVSLALYKGAVVASVLGTRLEAKQPLPHSTWSHIALTIDSGTINKQARLWVNGKRIDSRLVLEPWPESFQVAEMMSDHWNQHREFSGQLGDTRISRRVRYRTQFPQVVKLGQDEHTVLLLQGGRIPLTP
ncbi:MAG: LamG-like jellyroll fold domain-containing protein [Planctomycetaceae bacterium]